MNKINLDRELCFRMWVDLGSLTNVGRKLAEQGIYNKKTGKPYSNPAISYAARRWIFLNHQEARIIFAQNGWVPDDEIWYDWLVDTYIKAFHSHSDSRILIDFLDENGLREKYGHVIGEGKKP